MTRHDISDLRTTVWPGRKLPVPDVYVWPVCIIDGGKFGEFLSYARGASVGKHVSLPEDFYLRELFDLDLTNSESILEFSKNFGRLGRHGWKDLPIYDEDLEIGAYPKLNEINRLQERFLNDKGFEHPSDKYEIISIEEFIQHAAILRDIVRIWLVLSGNDEFQTVVDAWENGVWRKPKPPHSEVSAAQFLERYVNAGLRPFQVHLKLHDPDHHEPKNHLAIPRFTGINLYSAVCLQLANDITEGIRYKICANESCNRLFSKQRGRSEYGQFRTKSVKYCSAACARAQAQRQLRRRQTKAHTLRRQGETLKAISAATGADIETVKRWTAGIKAVRSKGKPKKKG